MRPLKLALAFMPFALAAQAPAPVPVNDFQVPWGREGRPRDPAVAPDGNIFFVGQAGSFPKGNYIARLNPKTGEFKQYELDPGTNPHSCIVDARGQVWYSGNRNGTIGRLDPTTGAITRYPMPDSSVRDPHTMVFDRRGNIWFTAQNSNAVGYLDVTTGSIRIVKTGNRTRPYGIALDSKGRPWFNLFATNKVGTLDPATFELKTYPLANEKTLDRRIAITSDDKIWYVDYARGQLGKFDPVTEKVEEWLLPGGPSSLPYGMTVDDRDRLWVAETGNPPKANRLVGFDPKSKAFFSITELQGQQNTVRYMIFDRKTKMIWFGSDAGFIGRADVSGVKTAM